MPPVVIGFHTPALGLMNGVLAPRKAHVGSYFQEWTEPQGGGRRKIRRGSAGLKQPNVQQLSVILWPNFSLFSPSPLGTMATF